MGWISGGCEPWPGPPGNLPLRIIELGLDVALARMEETEASLERYAEELPTGPLEHAALMERAETVTGELRWLREQMAKLAGRLEQKAEREARRAMGEPGERGKPADDVLLTRRACMKPWPGPAARRTERRGGGTGDDQGRNEG